ncbi:MAG: transporter [Gemmatimonadetes bacterium]|nr:transporter [Gemmatimonadota bacterium]
MTDRPDFTESSETVPTGMAQLESGATVQRVGEETGTTVGEALLRVGLASRVELRLGFNSYAVVRSPGARQQGLEDASVGAKLGLISGGGVVPKMSVIVASSVPTGAQPFRADKLQPEMKLTAAWASATVSPSLQTSTTAGFATSSTLWARPVRRRRSGSG